MRISITKEMLYLFVTFCIWDRIYGQIHYVISEESSRGSVVGNVSKDMGLHLPSISGRNLRVVSKSSKQYFKVNSRDGVLVVDDEIDREELCGRSAKCFVSLQLILENPMELHTVKVEIRDINDNWPRFPAENITLEISEAANVGTSYRLGEAQDPDVETNSISTYRFTPNEHFGLRIKTLHNGAKVPEIVLQKALDREQQAVHHVILIAFDGGEPSLSGTVNITVKVLDANDNTPTFNKSLYNVRVQENVPIGTVVINLKATDPDEGLNGEIEYSFIKGHYSSDVYQVFSIDSHTGEVRTNGALDFEETKQYMVEVKARDRGSPPAEEYCTVNIELIDVNDNAPEVIVNSLTDRIQEDALPGTVVALISVRDSDSGENGRVHLHLVSTIPFKLIPSFEDHYSLVTKDLLDRETIPCYNITVNAIDSGSPPLSTPKLLFIKISDVNDNSPRFSQLSYTTHIQENNHPGLYLCSLMASDPDDGTNSKLSYLILDQKMQGMPVASYFYLNSENGTLYSARSFDYEEIQVFHIQIQVEDAGIPSRRSNVTVYVFILDQNDNIPNVIYPKSVDGAMIQQTIPRSAPVGYLVTKIVGVDADSGHNAWLSYRLKSTDDTEQFLISPYSGEIRTTKSLQDIVDTSIKIIIEVEDNGKPALSTSVTLLLFLEEKQEGFSSFNDIPVTSPGTSNLTLYLIISLIVISLISFVTFIALAINCLRHRNTDALCSAALCCCREQSPGPKYAYDYSTGSLRIQLNSDGPLKYVEVRPSALGSQAESVRACFPSLLDGDDFLYMKHGSASDPNTSADVVPSNTSNTQTQPNTDWRFSQAPRPGTSGTGGSQHLEEVVGPWPTNQMESERIQAMMAAANEITDATSTLGAGTLGLSARYGPQFTLQHVPDYRQNVYIPGSTATLNNSSGKKDGKGATSSGGHKRKSGKKDKK